MFQGLLFYCYPLYNTSQEIAHCSRFDPFPSLLLLRFPILAFVSFLLFAAGCVGWNILLGGDSIICFFK